MGAAEVNGSVRAQDQHSCVRDATRQVLEKQKRGLIRPVEVIQKKDKAALRVGRGGLSHELCHSLEQAVTLVVAEVRSARRQVRKALVELGH